MNLRNKVVELSNKRFKLPKSVIPTVVIAYALFGAFSVYETLKTQICQSYEEITRAKIITIRPTNTETRDRDRSNEKNTQTPEPITCYDYAEVYAEKYQVNADLLKRIIEAFPEDYKTAIALAKAESGLDPSEIGDKHMMKWSYGLFQINRTWHDYTPAQLLDANFNIKIAREIYDKAGWERWSTYKNEAYLQYL